MRRLFVIFFILLAITTGVVFFTQSETLSWLTNSYKQITQSTTQQREEKTVEATRPETASQEDRVKTTSCNIEQTCPCLAQVIPEVVEQLVNSVVSISVTQEADKTKSGDKIIPFDPGAEIFKDYLDSDSKAKKVESGGSGFIIKGPDNLLYVLTNAHVLGKASEIVVITHDKTKFFAELKAGDVRSDLAILKLKGQQKFPSNCKPVEWGDANKYPVGAPVIAIGNPFEFGSSVSDGIISFKNRDIPRPIGSGLPAGQRIKEFLSDMMQHTAPINIGSSGGPLIGIERVDEKWVGRVVGVNSTMLTTTGGNIGISFAIPSTIALPITDKLFKSGKVDYAWLGIIMQELLDSQKSVLGLSTAYEAYKVVEVEENSPAQKAGLEKGDIVTHLETGASGNLSKDIQKLQPGENITLIVFKNGLKKDEQKITVTLGIRPDSDIVQKKTKKVGIKKWPEGAFKISDLDLVLEKQTVPLNGKKMTGFKVVDLDPEHAKFSLEAKDSLEPGDVLLSLNGEPLIDRQAVEQQVGNIIHPKEQNKEGMPYAILSFNVYSRDGSLKDAIYRYDFRGESEES